MRDDGFKQNSFLKRDVKMMRTCKNCGKEFDDVYDVCPSCGAYEEEPEDMTEKDIRMVFPGMISQLMRVLYV